MKPIYGPVPSWRLGRSLGVDPVCEKACSFECVYCQLGKVNTKTDKRRVFISEEIIKKELKDALKNAEADVVTFSGVGEPTLAENLGKIIDAVREVTDLPVAILTNSSLIHLKDVRDDLKKADIVIAKLDAPNDKLFEEINLPLKGITFEKVVSGIKQFREEFKGKLCLQIMFLEKNKDYAFELAQLAKELKPDEVQINTPLRPCAVKPLSKQEIERIKKEFKSLNLNIVSVYEAKKPKVKVLNMHDTLIRRPEL